MNNTEMNSVDALEAQDYMLPSYLNYSMYVILNRSLPHIMDGLKPVQRRILYAMNELKLDYNAKYKKSARTVGDTLGKYHPHGDSACYEAMVAMAQPFTTHHPLVDGQGNWGSVDDPKSFAAMRYTESKMSLYANTLLDEIKEDTVDWVPNFDGTMKEPELLPAKLPNILVNGVTGIAVGMATDVPPFNLEEIVSACSAVLKSKSISDDEIINLFGVPDFPSGGVVTDPIEKVKEVYKTGSGSISLRGTYEIKDDFLFITSLPYRVVQQKVLADISSCIKKYKLPVVDMIDDSDSENPVRIGLQIKGNDDVKLQVLAVVLEKAKVESKIKVNMNVIGLDGLPQIKNLPTMVREWCQGRQKTFERKKRFRLRNVESRLHILEGLLIAFNNLDRVIEVVRSSEQPKVDLMEEFELTENQCQSILELKLRQLAKLEEDALQKESDQLSKERDEIKDLLSSDKKIKKEVRLEIIAAGKAHQKPRKTTHTEMELIRFEHAGIVNKKENVTVVSSTNFWLKQLKGHDLDATSLAFKTSECVTDKAFELTTDDSVYFMSKMGKFFTIPISKFPKGKSTEFPASTQLTLEGGDELFQTFSMKSDSNMLFVTAKGNGFLTPSDNLESKVTKGKQVLVLTEKDEALPPVLITTETELAMTTKLGRLVIVNISELNTSNRSQGTKLIDIKPKDFISSDDFVTSFVAMHKEDKLVVHSGKRNYLVTEGKKDKYRIARSRRGVYFESSKSNLSLSLER